MTVGVLIVTHNNSGKELLGCCNSIFGEAPLAIEAIGVSSKDCADKAQEKIINSIERLDDGDGVLLITDLYGATPCNISIKVMQSMPNKIKIITGINLQMVLKTFNYFDLELEQLAAKVLFGGSNGINLINKEKSA
ncbi:MAG: PTS fructose transporter subunit IIA [Gammaproteobacteria bacterium]|nr:MAG: PTS fructose transporter subunit IIA [Gammaproteobacteria bacterium]